MAFIEIYTRGWCGYCRMAKQLLAAAAVDYTEYEISGDPGREREMIRRSGRTSVPQIFVDGMAIGGFVELTRFGDIAGLARDRNQD